MREQCSLKLAGAGLMAARRLPAEKAELIPACHAGKHALFGLPVERQLLWHRLFLVLIGQPFCSVTHPGRGRTNRSSGRQASSVAPFRAQLPHFRSGAQIARGICSTLISATVCSPKPCLPRRNQRPAFFDSPPRTAPTPAHAFSLSISEAGADSE